MFPDPHRQPPGLLQQAVGLGIPRAIPLDLVSPELLVRSRPPAVKRAAVPEAPIHEHGNPYTRKGDVSGSPHASHRAMRDSVSHSPLVQVLPQELLWSCVARPIAPHGGADRAARRPGGCRRLRLGQHVAALDRSAPSLGEVLPTGLVLDFSEVDRLASGPPVGPAQIGPDPSGFRQYLQLDGGTCPAPVAQVYAASVRAASSLVLLRRGLGSCPAGPPFPCPRGWRLVLPAPLARGRLPGGHLGLRAFSRALATAFAKNSPSRTGTAFPS